MKWLIKRIVGTKNKRDLKAVRPLVARINELEEEYQGWPEEKLRGQTVELRARLEAGESLDDVLPEAFATVKNACRRLLGTTVDRGEDVVTWDMVPFDVQLLGGIILHQGKIAEMATGEGKTLTACMPLYLNALAGSNVHLVTVNDYLARIQAREMGHVFTYLGLTVGCIQSQMSAEERRKQYSCDITYGTNSEFGFDYLRDNGMAWTADDLVQGGHFYAIVDEIDSILIDEARTPLIISGPAPQATHQYHELKPRVERLVRAQRDLCNRLVREAQEAIDRSEEDEEAEELAMLRLYQVRQGMPRHKQLMKLMEEPSARRLIEKIEALMLTDMRKEQGRELREEMFFTIDERGHDASLTEKGCEELNPKDPEAYVLPDLVSLMAEMDADPSLSEDDRIARRQQIQDSFAVKSERIHNVDQLIRAYCVYERDVAYVVQDNRVMIVDEHTGRVLAGRRWSDGLHQAVEAKEGVKIEQETQTLASITLQNYFRMYEKLAGMTGTAETEANEFSDIYDLDVIVVPTNRPVRRVDDNDLVFKTQREKYRAVIEEIEDCHERGQPVLVGTVSVETSEVISRMLRRANITHNVLNAKNIPREAEIVKNAGLAGSVTIATNMAGRGTDIKLGPGVVYLEESVVKSQTRLKDPVPEGSEFHGKTLVDLLNERPCGLHVIGSERHEARRIDRQLRGRCARQGDPGSSRFYVSLEDDLMRLFGSERIAGIMEKLGLEEGQVLEHRWLNRSIESAQRRVEQHHYAMRKRTLEYDDVMNKQREIIYDFRREIISSPDVRARLLDVIEDVVATHADALVVEGSDEDASGSEFLDWVHGSFPVAVRAEELHDLDAEAAADLVFERVRQAYELKAAAEDAAGLIEMERFVMLRAIDTHWQEYLRAMDGLREGIHLRAYGQRDPLVEYKKEAYDMFADLMDDIKGDIGTKIFRSATSAGAFDKFLSALPQNFVHDSVSVLANPTAAGAPPAASPPKHSAAAERGMEAALASTATVRRTTDVKVGRNDPCPCGSGRKYKKCCGAA